MSGLYLGVRMVDALTAADAPADTFEGRLGPAKRVCASFPSSTCASNSCWYCSLARPVKLLEWSYRLHSLTGRGRCDCRRQLGWSTCGGRRRMRPCLRAGFSLRKKVPTRTTSGELLHVKHAISRAYSPADVSSTAENGSFSLTLDTAGTDALEGMIRSMSDAFARTFWC